MKLPDHYKNLSTEKKRIVVSNLISQFGNEEIQRQINSFTEDQVNFLFTYFFTESKEKRERMWYDMHTEYEATIRELEHIARKVQMLNIKYREFLANEADKKSFLKKPI